MDFKKKIIFVFLISPSILFNYITLTFLDHNNDLSNFSTLFIIVFNLANIIFGVIYYRFSLKVFLSFFIYCIVLFLIFDFTLEKIINKKSINKEDHELGWTLKPNKDINFPQKTFKGEEYIVKFKSSSIDGFREYGNLNSKNKKILVIGDSYTGGPYASDHKMYYSIIRKIFDKNSYDFEWFVMGASGYGTAQQFLLLKKHYNTIKPNIILHQFCVNDFFDNSINISKLSTAHDQYLRRPYYKNEKIFKVDNAFSKIYRFLFKNSFIFKKIDQIYSYKQFRSFGRFKKEIPQNMIIETINNTQILFTKIREVVGDETLYFSINCADKNNNHLTVEWMKIIKNINGFPIVEPGNKLIELKEKGIDVNHEDGGHLNTYGNEIYGEITASKMIDIMKNEKY